MVPAPTISNGQLCPPSPQEGLVSPAAGRFGKDDDIGSFYIVLVRAGDITKEDKKEKRKRGHCRGRFHHHLLCRGEQLPLESERGGRRGEDAEPALRPWAEWPAPPRERSDTSQVAAKAAWQWPVVWEMVPETTKESVWARRHAPGVCWPGLWPQDTQVQLRGNLGLVSANLQATPVGPVSVAL